MERRIFLGTQGWNYEGWVGPFYPRGTKARDMLGLYSRVFNSVEVDSTFYAIPPESSVKAWADRSPDNFTFSFKLPSEITHRHRLHHSAGPLKEFLNRL